MRAAQEDVGLLCGALQVIAHRLTTIRNADSIAFVKGGKVRHTPFPSTSTSTTNHLANP